MFIYGVKQLLVISSQLDPVSVDCPDGLSSLLLTDPLGHPQLVIRGTRTVKHQFDLSGPVTCPSLGLSCQYEEGLARLRDIDG